MPHCARFLRMAALAVVCVLASVTAWAVELHQTGTIEALVAGDYAGLERYAVLRRHGDFGLGTFTNLDGEMVALDGRFYQVKSDGIAREASPDQMAPFAQLVFFTGSLDLGRADGLDLAGLGRALSARLPDPTRFYAVRVDGLFSRVKTRSAPAQARPWPPLATALTRQVVFPLDNVSGTLVGIYSPPAAPGLSVPGWHFHFLTADRKCGGHVLALRTVAAKARGDQATTMTVVFPKDPTPQGSVPPPVAGTE